MISRDAIVTASARFGKPPDRTFQYGTAGVCDCATPLYEDILIDWVLVSHGSVSPGSSNFYLPAGLIIQEEDVVELIYFCL